MKLLKRVFVCLCATMLWSACQDAAYDLSDMDTDDIVIGGDESVFSGPLGSLTVDVSDVLDWDDINEKVEFTTSLPHTTVEIGSWGSAWISSIPFPAPEERKETVFLQEAVEIPTKDIDLDSVEFRNASLIVTLEVANIDAQDDKTTFDITLTLPEGSKFKENDSNTITETQPLQAINKIQKDVKSIVLSGKDSITCEVNLVIQQGAVLKMNGKNPTFGGTVELKNVEIGRVHGELENPKLIEDQEIEITQELLDLLFTDGELELFGKIKSELGISLEITPYVRIPYAPEDTQLNAPIKIEADSEGKEAISILYIDKETMKLISGSGADAFIFKPTLDSAIHLSPEDTEGGVKIDLSFKRTGSISINNLTGSENE